jgi:hypothetical protein
MDEAHLESMSFDGVADDRSRKQNAQILYIKNVSMSDLARWQQLTVRA